MEKVEATPSMQQYVKEFVVLNKMGIHARPAAMVVRITIGTRHFPPDM